MTARSPGPLRQLADGVRAARSSPNARSCGCRALAPSSPPGAPRAAFARGVSSMECGSPAAAFDGRSNVTPLMVLRVPRPSRFLPSVGSYNPTSTQSLLSFFVGSPVPTQSQRIRPRVTLSARRLRAKDLNPRFLSPMRSSPPQSECAAASCWCRAPEGILLFAFHSLMTRLSSREVLP
jgi:hypothetical protein